MNISSLHDHQESTILIVDDTPANVQVMADFLEERNFNVISAEDGEEGLKRAEFVQPDLILLDVMMPGIDGFQTCRFLKANEKTKNIPIIFMTALSDVSDKVTGLEAGGVDYVTKPFQLEEILARVNTHLAISKLQKKLEAQNLELKREIAIRKETEAALKQSADEINSLYNNASCGYHSLDKTGLLIEINDTELKWMGRHREDVIGKLLFTDVISKKSLDGFYEKFPEVKEHGWVVDLNEIELDIVRSDGVMVPVILSAMALKDGDGNPLISRAKVFDITERKQAQEKIRYLADHDTLTNLLNRGLLKDCIKRDIEQARINQSKVAVLFIDLDHFKQINDSLGHHVGDHLLKLAASRLATCVRKGDSVARLGGDEFVICLPDLMNGTEASLIATKILKVLQQPFTIAGHELHVSCSIGISLYPNDGDNEQLLMRNADSAMYSAKAQGRNNFQFFSQKLNDWAMQCFIIESSLHKAIAHSEFSLHYQPKVNVCTGKVIGAEALIRWRNSDNVLVSPGEFIPVAEKSGLIIQIGEWVLRQACKQNKAWQNAGYAAMPIAVNVSAAQFRSKDFLEIVSGILSETEMAPCYLELELTESILMQDVEAAIALLEAFKRMGLKLSIDDFGTGYSSLSYLKRFPIDTLKIDQSFIRDITTDPDDAAITSAIVGMANSLKKRVIAEGVETIEQLEFLRHLGCDEIQGYYFSRPLPSDDFEAKILQNGLSINVKLHVSLSSDGV